MKRCFLFWILLLLTVNLWAQDRQWIVTSDELVTYRTVNYTNPVDTLKRGDVIQEVNELRGHIKYINNGHVGYAPMTGLEEWNGNETLADGTPVVIISGAYPPMTVSQYNAVSGPNLEAIVGLRVFSYVMIVLGWILIIWGAAGYKNKSLAEKEDATAKYWYGNLVKLAVGYILVMSVSSISLLPAVMKKKIELSPGDIIMLVQTVLLWIIALVLSVMWCFKWRKKILGLMLWNRKIGNEAISWFFILINGVICFIVLEFIIGPIGYLVGLGLFIYLILPVRNQLNMRCARCHGYWDNVIYQGRHIDGVKAVNSSDKSVSTDTRVRGNRVIETRKVTTINRTDYYRMYREDYHCVECSHHWHRRYKGERIGSDIRKEVKKEETDLGPVY